MPYPTVRYTFAMHVEHATNSSLEGKQKLMQTIAFNWKLLLCFARDYLQLSEHIVPFLAFASL